MGMDSQKLVPWHLAAVIEVPYDDRIQCQCKGCGHIVYKRVHLIVWIDGRIECWGQDCYARELGITRQGRTAKPIYDLGGRRKLTEEERELLKDNREQLIAKFQEEQQKREQQIEEQAERERQETLRFTALRRQPFKHRVTKPRKFHRDTSQMEFLPEREGICEICGKKTRHWWCYDGKTGMCRCQDCKRQGKEKPEGQKNEGRP